MLKKKFLIPSCIMIGICMTFIVYFKSVNDIVERDSQAYIFEIMQQSTLGIKRSVYNVFDVLKTVSLAIDTLGYDDTTRIIKFLITVMHQNNFKRMGLIYLDGKVVTTDGGTTWLRDRDYAKKAFSGKTNLSDVLEERIGVVGKEINVYATPLIIRGKVIAVLFAACDMDFLGKMLSTTMFGGNGFIYLVRGNGQLVAAQRAIALDRYAEIRKILGRPLAPDEKTPLQLMGVGTQGTVRVNIDGTPSLVSYDSLDEDDLYVLAVVPLNVLRAETSRRLLPVGLFMGVLALLTLLWLVYVWRLHRQTERDELHLREEEAASKAKSRFLSTVSHEIRTPLNAVTGFVRKIEQTGLSPEQQDYVCRVKGAAAVLTQIVNDILDFSQLDMGRLRLSSAPFVLDNLLAQSCELVADLAQKKGLALRVYVEPGTPQSLLGDAARLEQILFNLLTNAVKFSAFGEIFLNVSCAPSQAAQQNQPEKPSQAEQEKLDDQLLLPEQGERCVLLFSVRDAGIGLSPEQAQEIFRPFAQADGTRARIHGGTGLGLAICHHLVSLMKGTIGVTSHLGCGANFTFSVPLGIHVPTEKQHTPDLSTSQAWEGVRVLVVEDNDINLEIICDVLMGFGVQVDTAENGSIALSLALSCHYALIFMDLQMPIMDGLETTRRLRALGNEVDSPVPWLATVPVVALTANDQPDDRQQCAEVGMSDMLGKPLDIAAVRRCLEIWVNKNSFCEQLK